MAILPGPITSIIYFMILTIIYGILMIYNINSSEHKNFQQIEDSSSNNIYIFIYVLLIFGGMFYINTLIYKGICSNNSINFFEILSSTLLPLVLIFGVLYFILELFDGWIRPFSNTIGYGITYIMGINDYHDRIYKDQIEDMKQIILNINNNKSKFINELSKKSEDFNKYLEALLENDIIKPYKDENDTYSDDILNLYKLVNIKYIIGKLCWYLLVGTIMVSISYNYIINLECQSSISNLNSNVEDLYNNATTTIFGNQWQKYNLGVLQLNDIYDIDNVALPKLKDFTQFLISNDVKGMVYLTDGDILRFGINNLTLSTKNYVITDTSNPSNIIGYKPIS